MRENVNRRDTTKMKKNCNTAMKILTALIAFCAMIVSVQAASVWSDADAASPILIRYTDADGTGTVTITTHSITLTDSGQANSLELTAATYLSNVVETIVNATNAAQEKNFEVIYWGGLPSDLVSNKIVAASATTVNKEWSRVAKWDTSTCLHYDVVTSSRAADSTMGNMDITQVFADPTGTGDVTLEVYVAGTRQFLKTYESPIYVLSDTNTTNNADNNIAVDLSFSPGIHVGPTQVGFIRATRETTATTGGIGACFTRP